jgi:hypothetical protein
MNINADRASDRTGGIRAPALAYSLSVAGLVRAIQISLVRAPLSLPLRTGNKKSRPIVPARPDVRPRFAGDPRPRLLSPREIPYPSEAVLPLGTQPFGFLALVLALALALALARMRARGNGLCHG